MTNIRRPKSKKAVLEIRGYCHECFTPLSWRAAAHSVRCPECNAVIKLKELGQALEFASTALICGYLEPSIRKEDKRAGKEKRYALAPDVILTWLALAVVGGVVGNLSYDLLKVAIKKLLGRKTNFKIYSQGETDLKRKQITIGYKKQTAIVMTEDEVKLFIQAVRKFIKSEEPSIAKLKITQQVGKKFKKRPGKKSVKLPNNKGKRTTTKSRRQGISSPVF